MHSHDKTMLSKLGFSDPDKRNPKHDLACLYVASSEIASKVFSRFEHPWAVSDGERVVGRGPATISTELEHHLQKGEGQYATTIGFIDVVYTVSQSIEIESSNFHYGDNVVSECFGAGIVIDDLYNKSIRVRFSDQVRSVMRSSIKLADVKRVTRRESGVFLVEVKIEPVGYGEILRQLNLYKSYFRCNKSILITAWTLASFEKEAIEKTGVMCLPLGEKFDSWAKEKMKLKEMDMEGL